MLVKKKDKLQVCVSFKHTDEEESLYLYTLDQGDKSIFIKNLIRQYRDGILNQNHRQREISIPDNREVIQEQKKRNNIIGKKTKNKFLA